MDIIEDDKGETIFESVEHFVDFQLRVGMHLVRDPAGDSESKGDKFKLIIKSNEEEVTNLLSIVKYVNIPYSFSQNSSTMILGGTVLTAFYFFITLNYLIMIMLSYFNLIDNHMKTRGMGVML